VAVPALLDYSQSFFLHGRSRATRPTWVRPEVAAAIKFSMAKPEIPIKPHPHVDACFCQ
jgi:hypothetical protein